LKRSFNQRACIRIIHVIDSASTPFNMTGAAAIWLQSVFCRFCLLCHSKRSDKGRRRENFVTAVLCVRSYFSKAPKALKQTTNQL
jgi:hypothetical protein